MTHETSSEETIIKCPKCGREYLLAEIYYPEDLTGKPQNIIKDENGKIISYSGIPSTKNQEFICDSCNSKFSINCNIEVSTTLQKDDFEEEYIVKIIKK